MRCPGDGPAEYSTADIQVPSDTVLIRRRPGMYIGDTDARGLHQLLFELVNEALAPDAGTPASAVRVALCANGFAEVRGDHTPPADLEIAFGTIHPGIHSAPAGTIANALSEELTARALAPGTVVQCTFRRGQLHAAMQSAGPPDGRGLAVRFKPDPNIFGATQFDHDTIRTRLQQCAFLHSGVRIAFADEVNGTEDVFEFADGVASYVKWLNAGRTALHPEPVVVRGDADGVRYEVGLQWCAEEELSVLFANGYHTENGGTHESGFRTAVTRTVNDFLREHRPKSGIVKGEDARAGLTAVVSVRVTGPIFFNATRSRLCNSEVEQAVATNVARGLRGRFEVDREFAECVVRLALAARAAREAVQATRNAN